MKKTYKLIATLLMAVLALQGCVKEYTKALPGEEQPTPEQPVVEDDDMVTLLKSIQGVSDVEMKMVPFANGSTIANYFFNYEQLVDQFDEKKGTFKQRIAMQLADPSAPVIVHTLGYAMTMEGKFAVEEHLKQFLNANWVEIEYRYFGSSLPEPLEDMNLTYLYSDQAAVDIHNVVTMLRENLFKDNLWVATGSSKGGTTTGLQAYYSDKYGWKDFNLYVPFCGPFLAGTPESPTDRAIGSYLMTSCGFGYEESTDEAKAYVNLHKILKQCVTKPRRVPPAGGQLLPGHPVRVRSPGRRGPVRRPGSDPGAPAGRFRLRPVRTLGPDGPGSRPDQGRGGRRDDGRQRTHPESGGFRIHGQRGHLQKTEWDAGECRNPGHAYGG